MRMEQFIDERTDEHIWNFAETWGIHRDKEGKKYIYQEMPSFEKWYDEILEDIVSFPFDDFDEDDEYCVEDFL